MSSDPRSSAEHLDASIPGSFPEALPPGGYSSQQSLAQAIHARRAEYTRPKRIKIKIGTWNVAAYKGTEKDIGGWLIGGKGVAEELAGLGIASQDQPHGDTGPTPEDPRDQRETVEDQEARRTRKESTIPRNDPGSVDGGEDIGIYAVGLQEVLDISSATEALRPYTDPATANKFKSALDEALPNGYQLVAEQQLIGLLLLIYAAPDIAQEVKSVSTTSVGTGLMGYMGNKGAVTARIVIGETTRLVFVNCHLAAGADAGSLERRNWDAAQITSRTRFDPITDSLGAVQGKGETIGDEDFAFWFGDLNYRLQGMPGDDVRRLLMLHTRNEYDLKTRNRSSSDTTNSSVPVEDSEDEDIHIPANFDPASLQTTLDSLLPHDELYEQIKTRKAFHDGWREGAIKFMPTYKYDVGSVGIFDSSEKRRCPSWCDRILYRTRRDKLAYDNKFSEEEEAKKRDEEIRERGIDQASEDDDVLFDSEYNPETDGDDYDEYDEYVDDGQTQVVETRAGFEDEIKLEMYTSHQRVLSSDHKPLAAVFSFKYDAVVPELKTKIHQEVARELDRAENEGRPTVTLLVDRSHSSDHEDLVADDDTEHFEGVNFGAARYGQSKRRSITIANTGQVPATVSFVDRPVSAGQIEGPMPIWLSAKFDREADSDSSASKDTKLTSNSPNLRFTLDPGDATTVTLLLRVEVMELVKSLNEGIASLDDILVLRVEDGRDHFLPVRAKWLHSSLGRSIDKLIRIPEGGVRRLQGQKPNSGSGHRTDATCGRASGTSSPASLSHTDTNTVKWSAPRELFRLTEAVENLAQRSIAEWDMTAKSSENGRQRPPWELHSGWPFWEDSWSPWGADARKATVSSIYEALDVDKPFDELIDAATPVLARLEAFAGVLVTFLTNLGDGVITPDLWDKVDADMTARERDKSNKQQPLPIDDERSRVMEIMAEMPAHNVSFVLVTSMLSRLIAEETASDHTATAASVKSTPHKREASTDSASTTPSRGIPILRRRAASRVSEDEGEKAEKAVQTRRKLREKAYAVTFAEAMIRMPNVEGMKERERRSREERGVHVIELFLKEDS
ncbi:DNase I-like protein [Rhizodiscina lignyota]|uniref:DNase I-like protein n=1 Tax=Rhizodiscina lignyota TaxID=1504668 RepID=A0A9P4I9W7_9PEZI|nr:DNase I-like protein [Rhizodiscina lignyota]